MMSDKEGRLAVLIAKGTLMRNETLAILFGEQWKWPNVDSLETEGMSALNRVWSSAILAGVSLKADITA